MASFSSNIGLKTFAKKNVKISLKLYKTLGYDNK